MDFPNYEFLKKLKTIEAIDEIWLYGSRARGDNRERSDIDLAVLCPMATERDWAKVLEIIEGADTLLKIDCVRFDTLNENNPLRVNILRDHVTLYAKQKV